MKLDQALKQIDQDRWVGRDYSPHRYVVSDAAQVELRNRDILVNGREVGHASGNADLDAAALDPILQAEAPRDLAIIGHIANCALYVDGLALEEPAPKDLFAPSDPETAELDHVLAKIEQDAWKGREYGKSYQLPGVRYVTEAGNTLYVNGKQVGEVDGAGGALLALAEMLDDVGHTPCTLDLKGMCANTHLYVEDLRPSPGLDPEASRVLAGLARDSWDHPRSAGAYQVPGVRTASIQGDTLYLNGEPAGVTGDRRNMEALLAGLHPREASATVELLGHHANTRFYLDEARIVETHALPAPSPAVQDAPPGEIVSGPSSVRVGAIELPIRS